MVGHPVELPAMRSDGSEFPVEIAITRPLRPGPTLFTGFLRDITERKRVRAGAAHARRRAGRAAAGRDHRRERGRAGARVRGGDRGGRPPAGARSRRTWCASSPTAPAIVTGAWSTGSAPSVAGGHARGARRPDRGGADPRQRLAGAGRQLRGRARLDRRDAARPRLPLERRRADQAGGAALGRGDGLDGRREAVPGRDPSSGSPTSRSSWRSRSRTPRRGSSWRLRARASWRPATPSGGGSSATCTTARSSGWSRPADPAAVREHSWPTATATWSWCGAPSRSSPARSRSCASWRAASIRRSSPTAGSSRRSRCSRGARASRSTCARTLDERLPAPVEAAAYYIVAEALTNASKHAGAARVRVDVRLLDGAALVEVADDGVGGADAARGIGPARPRRPRRRARRRAGGREPRGRGTTLRARLPLRT